jgi:hypothetical protein
MSASNDWVKMPALFTRTSTRPKRANAVSAILDAVLVADVGLDVERRAVLSPNRDDDLVGPALGVVGQQAYEAVPGAKTPPRRRGRYRTILHRPL